MSDMLPRRRTVRLAALPLLLACSLLAPTAASAQAKPFSLEQVTTLLRGGVQRAYILELVRPSCVAFEMTPENERSLRDGGADESFVGALKGFCIREGAAEPPASSGDAQGGGFAASAEFLAETLTAVPWRGHESAVLVTGTTDTLSVRLDTNIPVAVPHNLLTWTSDAPSVVAVDETGIIYARAPGQAYVTATAFGRRVATRVQVYERPSQVLFDPDSEQFEVTTGETRAIRVDFHLPTGQQVRGLTPKLAVAESAVLGVDAAGNVIGAREGVTTLTAVAGDVRRRWQVRVVSPSLRITSRPSLLRVGDSLRLSAERWRPGGPSLGEAMGTRWRSSDSSVLVVDGAVVTAHKFGQATLTAQLGRSEDTLTVTVLGDVLVAARGKVRQGIHSLSFAHGELAPLGPSLEKAQQAALSPDGRTLAYVSTHETRAPRLYVSGIDGSNPRRLIPEKKGVGAWLASYEEHSPNWSPDGRRVVFVSSVSGNYEIMSVALDGSDLQRLTDHPAVDWRVSVAPDAPRMAFERVVAAGDSDIMLSLLDGSEARAIVSGAQIREGSPKLLPGGTRILFTRGAYLLDENAGEALALIDLSRGEVQRDLVSPLKGHRLIYAVSPDGKAIAYHQHGLWNCSNTSVVVIDTEGAVLRTIGLGAGVDVQDLSWGASSTSTMMEVR